GLARAFAEVANRQNATWKKNETDHGKFPIHQEQHNHRANDGGRLFENVAADAGQRLLHVAGVVLNPRHEITAFHPIEEIHRMPNHFVEKLVADVVDDLVAYPRHVVGVAVGAETAHGHHHRNGQTNPNDRIDLWPDI